MKNTVRILLIAACGSLHQQDVVLAQDAPQMKPALQAEEIRAQGDWASATDVAAHAGQRWNLDALRFEDNEIRGRISVSGSPLFHSANVEGRLSGRGFFGKLMDDSGNELATFEGTVTSTGASGTYRDKTGDVGEWQWGGQPGQ